MIKLKHFLYLNPYKLNILDKIIENNTPNQDMFHNVIKDNLQNFIKGINMSVFAYGQTSTGKTFTMRGTDKNPGIIPLAIKEIFRLLDEDKTITKYTLKASYLELYNEQVNDLLNANNKNLEIRESAQKGVFVNNLTEVLVTNTEKAMQLLKQGDSVRVIAETKLNEKSSRSHSVLRLSLEVNKSIENNTNLISNNNNNNNNNASIKNNSKTSKTFFAQMNLIDLAGSENVSKAKTDGIRMKEGSNINKSLLALSNVISKLSANPKSFVNFRDSKLTRLLQNGLSGNSKTTIICTITEALGCYSETINTLHFGNKAKNIKTDIKINELLDEKHKIMSENNQLKNKIKLLEEMMKEKKELEEKEKALKAKDKEAKVDDCKSVKNEKVNKIKEAASSETQSGKNAGSFDKIFSENNSSKESTEEERNKEKM